jgi:hypothetical protein
MESHRVTASALIKAPTEQVYAILADYHDGHPHILPKPYFSSLEVEQGGIGAGTLIRVQMRVLGKTQTFRAVITEPEPGRVLVETILTSGIVTTFTVHPVEEGQHPRAQARITTELKPRGGVPGLLERFLTTLLLRRIYTQELKLLAALAEGRSRAPSEHAPNQV